MLREAAGCALRRLRGRGLRPGGPAAGSSGPRGPIGSRSFLGSKERAGGCVFFWGSPLFGWLCFGEIKRTGPNWGSKWRKLGTGISRWESKRRGIPLLALHSILSEAAAKPKPETFLKSQSLDSPNLLPPPPPPSFGALNLERAVRYQGKPFSQGCLATKSSAEAYQNSMMDCLGPTAASFQGLFAGIPPKNCESNHLCRARHALPKIQPLCEGSCFCLSWITGAPRRA